MYNVLVTGIGSVIGYGIINSLIDSSMEVNIIGTDIYTDAVGQKWCDFFEPGVLANHDNYPEFLYEVIKKYKVDLVIPGIEQDIDRIVLEWSKFEDLDVKFAINNHGLIKMANDKWHTHIQLLENNLSHINTFIDGDFNSLKEKLGSPMLLKPRRSYASKGIHKIYDQNDYLYWKEKLNDNFMVQQIVGDVNSEYTVGVFGLGNGRSSQKISLKRVLGPDGATSKAKLVDIENLNKTVDYLVSIFKPSGPTNFQFRYHEGEYLLLEINPRISSSTSIRNAFGYNEAEMCIEYYLQEKPPSIKEIRSGTAVRYLKDLVQYDSNNI